VDRGDQIPPFVVTPENWTEGNFQKWFRRNDPDVVLSTTPEPFNWLGNMGFDIPEDVGFVHLWKPSANDDFTGVFHNDTAIGESAVDFVVGMIHRNERGLPGMRQTLVLSTTWMDGKTTRNNNQTPQRRLRNEFVFQNAPRSAKAREPGRNLVTVSV
jgi:hypothetical protein